MSEYQYYEWQTVDRMLTPMEQKEVGRLSSHIEVSASRAVVSYDWSDFRYDPKQVLLDYFDAHFYFANWANLRLMFRFPVGLLEENEIRPYCIKNYITFETIGEHQVLDLEINHEEGGSEWIDYEANLSYFIHLREDLLDRDYRLLYLAWLKVRSLLDPEDTDEDEEFEDVIEPDLDSEADELEVEFETVDDFRENTSSDPFLKHEPPVPPGLKKLTPSLENFTTVFYLDRFLLMAAAEASPDFQETRQVDYLRLVRQLPREESDTFLARIAAGEPGVKLALQKRLKGFLPPERRQAAKPRTAQDLLQRAEESRVTEKKLKAEAARRQFVVEMEDLAEREDQLWHEVDELLQNGRRIASTYEEATRRLEKLQQLSEFQKTPKVFIARLQPLAQKYADRKALIVRWRDKRWIRG